MTLYYMKILTGGKKGGRAPQQQKGEPRIRDTLPEAAAQTGSLPPLSGDIQRAARLIFPWNTR